jgi:glycosyltransferase involved in cell wall biosynthesis
MEDKKYSISKLFGIRPRVTVSLWYKFRPPPWGGGNQFMLALREEYKRLGIHVRENSLDDTIRVSILNSDGFDLERFVQSKRALRDTKVIHRLDGIRSMYRAEGSGKEQDALVFSLNRDLATVSIVQSHWILERMYELGYQPVNPVIIPNASDPKIFHSRGRVGFSAGRKVRLITTAWSQNPNKGAEVYQWLDQNLDWGRFEFTFVGNSPAVFSNIRHYPAMPSKSVARFLRSHDIFITASRKEACSNAVIEALSCGLPVLYINSGSHAELVGEGGLAFNDLSDLLPQLDRLVDDYFCFQAHIIAPTIRDVAIRYLQAAGIDLFLT